MKRLWPLFVVCAVSVVGAAQFPQILNTNTVPGGTGAPPKTAAQALSEMVLPAGFKAAVFASEPDVQNPIQLTWDTHGRLWVAENYTMDSDRFDDRFLDRIVMFDNADGGTKFQTRRVFTDQIKNLMGFAIGYGGVWVIAAPQMLFIPDRNADGVPDGPPQTVLDGFAYTGGNKHTSANGLRFGIDGWIYGRVGHGDVDMLGAPGTPPSQRTLIRGSIFRYHPTTKVIEVLSSGTVNPWGQDWDKYGEHFFDSTIVGHLWYEMPGAKFVSTSAEPNLKAYELIDYIADHRFSGGSTVSTVIGAGGGGRGGGGRGAAPGGQRGAAADAPQGAQGRRGGDPPAGAGSPAAQAGREGGGRSWATGPWNNGHAVVGMMIYQGDNWPAAYRDRIYLLNLFGHRVNVETLERSGSGYLARRAPGAESTGAPGPDLFDMQDPWFRGIDITYGPDGGVFITDWSDTGDYHNRTGENRLSGRIYKITYGDARPSSGSDLTKLTVAQLVALNAHANEWFPRQARVEFSNRMADGRGIGNAKQLLRDQFARESDVVRKLRALWTLYAIGGTDEAFLLPLLKSPDEHLRVWGIRLLVDRFPIDALRTSSDAAVGRDTVWTQQRPAAAVGGPEVTASAAVMTELTRLAASDPSSLVRVVLASTMQRLPFSQRLSLATGLVAHKEDAGDKNLPLMVWYGLIPIAQNNPSALPAVAAKSELHATSKYIARRLAEDITTSPGPINEVIAAAGNRSAEYQMDVVEGLGQGLQGQRGLSKPAAWDGFVSRVVSSSNGALVEKVRALDATLGSAAALDDARRVARDASASAEARRSALQSLIDARASDLRQIAEPLLNDQAVNAVAATALSAFDDAAIAARLVEAYPRFVPADRPKLMAALTSRASFAGALLDAVAAGRLPRSAISAIDAQQMRSLNDAATTRKLGEVWGEIRDSPEAKKQLAARYKTELTPASLAAADLSQGRAIFAGTCGACHTLYGEGGKVGPDLTGAARRHDLDALLAKITDPSSELPADSRITILTLKDGRTVTGIVANRTATTISLRLTADPVTVALSDIASTAVSSASIMPEGLLEAMTPVQRRNLVAYLMGNEQVK